jgi:hypothetical protein
VKTSYRWKILEETTSGYEARPVSKFIALCVILFLSLLFVPLPAIALSVPTSVAPVANHTEVQTLTTWLQAKKCPNDAVYFVEAAQEYGIDYRILPVIWWKESQCGLHELNGNGFGFEPSGSLKKFSSDEQAIFYISQQLATARPYAGKTIQQKVYSYNSVGEPRYYQTFLSLFNSIQ